MTKDVLRYDLLVQDALKGVVRKLLIDAAKEGLPGEHHFYVTFRTTAPGVRLSQRMREKYPEEMTVVLQHQFWDLGVTEHSFEVGLSFGGVPERLLVPFESVVGFFDPSVQFGLKFEAQVESAQDNDEQGSPALPAPAKPSVVKPAPAKALRGAGSEPDEMPAPVALAPKASGKAKPAAKAAKADAEATKNGAQTPPASDATEKAGAQVVSLDAFRKKT
ncbi:MAG: SspB family protein [Bosea sp. (in: a-proteobacteria)]